MCSLGENFGVCRAEVKMILASCRYRDYKRDGFCEFQARWNAKRCLREQKKA